MARLLQFEDLRSKGITASRVTIWRWVRARKFPEPVKLGPVRNAWVEIEVDSFIAELVAERDEKAL